MALSGTCTVPSLGPALWCLPHKAMLDIAVDAGGASFLDEHLACNGMFSQAVKLVSLSS